MNLRKEDISTLVSIVGREGAFAALEKSKKIRVEDLVGLADLLGIKAGKKDPKRKLSIEIVRHVDKRITRSLDELKTMSKEDLIKYFEEIGCDEDEVVELLSTIDLKSRAKSKRALLEFAANQINSLGIFERLADRNETSSA